MPQPAPIKVEKVPEELLDQLHEATETFGVARKHFEEALDAPTIETEPRERAQEELRNAERHIEDVTEQIDHVLHKPADATDKAAPN